VLDFPAAPFWFATDPEISCTATGRTGSSTPSLFLTAAWHAGCPVSGAYCTLSRVHSTRRVDRLRVWLGGANIVKSIFELICAENGELRVVPLHFVKRRIDVHHGLRASWIALFAGHGSRINRRRERRYRKECDEDGDSPKVRAISRSLVAAALPSRRIACRVRSWRAVCSRFLPRPRSTRTRRRRTIGAAMLSDGIVQLRS